jgi:hypothetical protein
LVVSYLATFKLTNYPFITELYFSALVSLGLLTLITLLLAVLQQMKRREDTSREIFLTVWVFCVIGYCIALLPHSSARYLLPAFPPALMLLLNDPAWSFATRVRRIWLSCAICGASCLPWRRRTPIIHMPGLTATLLKNKEFRTSGSNSSTYGS